MYVLKSGVRIRAYCGFTSSIASKEDFISFLVLENLKDRAATVFCVYARVSSNCYILIEEFKDEPLIIRPFEVYQKHYDPIIFYEFNNKIINIKDIIKKSKQPQIVLGTSEGRYVAETIGKTWIPVMEHFNNAMTALAHPVRLGHKGQSYGGNTKFIVEFTLHDGKEEVVPVYADDHKVKKFASFQLSQESLKSKEALEMHLMEQMTQGFLRCKSFKVLNFEEAIEKRFAMKNMEKIDLKPVGFFTYHVIGRMSTIWVKWQMKIENRRRRRGTS